MRTETLSLRDSLAYGVFGLPLAMAALPVYVHVPKLYADVSGLSLALLGGLLLAARLVDAVIDPLIGFWSDRAQLRQRLILLALPLLALGMLALMHPPREGAALWLLVSLLLTTFAFSLASIAYQAWGAELGRSPNERTRLTASREGFGLFGVVLAAALPGLLSDNIAQGLAALAWLFVLLLAACGLLTLFALPRVPVHRPASGAMWPSLRRAFSNPRFNRLLAVFVVNGIAAALPATLVLFFVADVLHAEAWSGVFLALYFVSGVAFLPLWVALATRLGRLRAWLLSMALAVIAFSGAWGLGGGDVWAFAVVCVLSGAALGADLTLPAAMLADIAEEKISGAGMAGDGAQAGAYFGWWNLVSKLNLALAAGIALPLLGWLGYQPGAASTAAALATAYCLLPLGFKSLAAALAWRWRNSLEVPS